MKHALAIIPARGGSKGIPRKNLWRLNGKPLICWSIEAAQAAERVGPVVVSTDDAEIAEVSRAAGASVVMRPAAMSNDVASSEDALLHTLENLDAPPDLTVFLQCTSPLTRSGDIDNCIRTLIEADADSAFTATESHRFIWNNRANATGVNHNRAERRRRQDLEPEYSENGAVYVMRTPGFRQSRHRFFGKTVISEMPTTRSWEIDSPEDIRIVQALASLSAKQFPRSVEAVVFDFDGVMTDNAVYLSEDGKESVRCDLGDGWGIARLRDAGIRMAVISSERNPVVRARCEKLELECFQGLGRSKLGKFTAWCAEHGLSLDDTVYVGNDANDADCLIAAGLGVVPADAHGSARQVADWVLAGEGGKGAVRELCDLILARAASDG
jgi:YrbI family 3-deoxy-D-manno-octulosonate 8-phosphate phosphatase